MTSGFRRSYGSWQILVPIERVRPLTIIDIDSFIFNQDTFKDEKLTLGEVIDGYHQFVHMPHRKLGGDVKAAGQLLNDKSIGFPTYLVRELLNKGLYKAPDMLQQKGSSLF